MGFNRLHLKVSGKPVIEFDPSVMAWYVRFTNAQVAKTLSDDEGPYTIDLDSNNQVVGVELLGIKEFRMAMLRELPVDTSKVDFENARFVPAAAPHQMVEA